MHRVIQDVQQIKSVCQQLMANERRNAQALSQQNGFTNMAQTETQAAMQLNQCLQICNRIEQELQQMSTQQQSMQQSSPYGYGFAQQNNQTMGLSMQQPQNQSPNPALQQVMQADRQPYQNQYSAGQGGMSGPQQYTNSQQFSPAQTQYAPSQMSQFQNIAPTSGYGNQAEYGSQQTSNLSQVMQADRQSQQSQPQSGYSNQAGYGNQGAPGLSQVMQADRQSQSGSGYANYNSFQPQ